MNVRVAVRLASSSGMLRVSRALAKALRAFVRAGGVFWRLLVGYEQEGPGQKIEGLLGGWKPQNPRKLIEVIIAKLLSPLEPTLVSVSTPAASTNLFLNLPLHAGWVYCHGKT